MDCKKCKKSMILMTGIIVLEPDTESYENGKKEKIDIEFDRHVNCLYCQQCDSLHFLDDDN